MIQGRPSTTALRAATYRAHHQVLDQPLVFDDPLAVKILSPLGPLKLPPRTSPVRAWAAARGRFAEDALHAARSRGCTQYVILGAGLDTFAYRHAGSVLPVFEVDHPDTQAWKRSLLEQAGIAAPPALTYVAVDFARQSLVPELARSGFRPDEPAFFSWLGVTPYLHESAVWETIAAIRGLHPRNEIVFDYLVARSELSWRSRLAHRVIEWYVARLGEPLRFLSAPPAIRTHLEQIGFATVEDLDCPALNERYFRNRPDRLRIAGRIARLVHARA
ncbi:MAG: class I SAM-dependent methyltransferase [Bryobacterales bacterium]|nr:class I SAM-dependent methyltransferase [Bryobacterales bacterium]